MLFRFRFVVTVILNLWVPLNIRLLAAILTLSKLRFLPQDRIPVCNCNQPNGTRGKHFCVPLSGI